MGKYVKTDTPLQFLVFQHPAPNSPLGQISKFHQVYIKYHVHSNYLSKVLEVEDN